VHLQMFGGTNARQSGTHNQDINGRMIVNRAL